MFDINEQEGDTKAALELYKKYASAERGYREDVAAREMAYQVVRAQSLQQGKEIELLNKKNEVLQLQQRVSDQKAQSSRLLILLLGEMVAVAQAGQRVGLGHPPQRHLHALDLEGPVANRADQHHQQQDQQARGLRLLVADALLQLQDLVLLVEIGRESCRERVCQYG